jgi:hypothetical protein
VSSNGRDDLAQTSIATVALGEGRHAHDRIDGLRERLDWHVAQLGAAIAGVEESSRERGHRHADTLLVLTADVATLTMRIDAQEDLHAQRHRLLLDEMRSLRSDLALTRSTARHAADDAREARASRPDDGRLSEIAARVLESHADREAVAVERARDSIFARRERRAAVVRWVGQIVGWLTVGGGIVLAIQHC